MLLAGCRQIHFERAERIVTAESRLVIPDAAGNLCAELWPIGFFVRQRVGPASVREMNDRQSAAVVEKLFQSRFRGIAQSRSIPTAVVEDERVVAESSRVTQ